MDNLTFIVEMTRSLAWPIATTVIAITFKDPLGNLISQLENMKIQGAEFKFGKAVKEIKEEEKSKVHEQVTVDIPANLVRLSEISPRGAVLEAWLEVEDALINARKRCAMRKRPDQNDDSPLPYALSMNVINSFYNRGIVSADTFDLYRKLRAIRNEVVHARKLRLNPDEVYDFIELSMQLKFAFENAKPEDPNWDKTPHSISN